MAAPAAFVAPVQRLPLELLGEIVVLCVSDPIADVQLLRTLSSICTSWRVATLRTPRAWSRIIFQYPRNGVFPVPRTVLCTLQDAQEWFTRNGSCTKDVNIICSRDMPAPEQTALAELVSAHASEMRSFSIRFSELDEGLPLLKRCLTSPMPSLEVLDLSSFFLVPFIGDPIPLLPPHEVASILDHLPRLHTLISCGFLDRLPKSVLSRVTTLFVKTLKMETLFARLEADGGFNPVLRHLCIHTVSCGPAWRPSGGSTFECNVHTLQLHTSPCRAAFLFQMITFPRLTALSLHSSGFVRTIQKEVIAAFRLLVDTSKPALRELYLEGVWLADADLAKLLEGLPSLEHLVICGGSTTDKLVRKLASAPRGTRPWLCPRLGRLCLTSNERKRVGPMVSRTALEALAAARLKGAGGASSLSCVRLDDSTLTREESVWRWRDDPPGRYPGLQKLDCDLFGITPQSLWTLVEDLL